MWRQQCISFPHCFSHFVSCFHETTPTVAVCFLLALRECLKWALRKAWLCWAGHSWVCAEPQSSVSSTFKTVFSIRQTAQQPAWINSESTLPQLLNKHFCWGSLPFLLEFLAPFSYLLNLHVVNVLLEPSCCWETEIPAWGALGGHCHWAWHTWALTGASWSCSPGDSCVFPALFQFMQPSFSFASITPINFGNSVPFQWGMWREIGDCPGEGSAKLCGDSHPLGQCVQSKTWMWRMCSHPFSWNNEAKWWNPCVAVNRNLLEVLGLFHYFPGELQYFLRLFSLKKKCPSISPASLPISSCPPLGNIIKRSLVCLRKRIKEIVKMQL